MTELKEVELIEVASIEEAVSLIDAGLGGLTERNMVPASEVTDLLLDVRSALSDRAVQEDTSAS